MNRNWAPYDSTLGKSSQKEVTSLMRMFLYIIPSIAVILAIADFSLGFTSIAFTTLTVPVFCLASLFFLNKGYINTSMIIIIAIMIISTSIICVLGARIHEVGIIIFPVIVFFASLVMNVRGMIVTSGVVILCLAFISLGEYFGFFPDRNYAPGWIDLAVALTVLIVHTLMTFSFSNITKKNLKRVKKELKNQEKYKAEISENLVEKTEMLRLVHHRVKNNLLLINSLIELESYEKPAMKNELKEITESMHTIARAHDPLYHTDDYKQVATKPYLEKLISTFIQSNNVKALDVSITDCLLFHEKALLLGIIMQKILSSVHSLHLAELTIHLSENGDELELRIECNKDEVLSLGDTSLVQLLADQIDGDFKINPNEINISFPIKE